MTYETGTSTGPADLISSKLATFAAANGWTVQAVVDGLQFLKGSIRVNLAWDTDNVYGMMSAGYSSGSDWDDQPTPSGIQTLGNIQAGPYTAYHFYSGAESSSDYLHMAVEWSAGNFWHSYMGQLVKFGSYTGGQYYDSLYVEAQYKQLPYQPFVHRVPFDSNGSSNASNGSQTRADIDGKTNNWMMHQRDWGGNTTTGGMRGGLYGNLVQPIAYQKYNSLTPIHPVLVFGDRPSSLRSPLGRVPHLRQLSMRNLTSGQVLTIGGDNWQCFPLWTRSDAAGEFLPSPAGLPQMSWYLGIAYKR